MSDTEQNQVDRLTRGTSLLTLAVAIAIASQVELVPDVQALLAVLLVTTLALMQLIWGFIEHTRSLREAISQ